MAGICTSPIRPNVCPSCFHKVNEGSDRCGSPHRHLSSYLPRRHVAHEAVGLRPESSSALHLLENLRFEVNMTKPNPVKCQTLEFLGFLVNTRHMTLSLPHSKVTGIRAFWCGMKSQTGYSRDSLPPSTIAIFEKQSYPFGLGRGHTS